MKKYVVALVMLFAIAFWGVLPGLAQDTMQEEEYEGDLTEYSYGTVVRVEAGNLVLSEYDIETDQDIEVSYVISDDIELENIDSMSDVKAGDDIDLDYIEKDGVKMAVYIAKEEV